MQLKHDDRVRIEIYLQEGKSIMEISKILKHDYKTIFREVNNRKHLLLNSKTITHISSIEEHICNLLNKILKFVINAISLKEILVPGIMLYMIVSMHKKTMIKEIREVQVVSKYYS